MEFHVLMADQSIGINQAGANILWFQPGIARQNSFWSVSSGEHSENMLDCKTAASDDWFPVKDLWINYNPFEKFVLFHNYLVPQLYNISIGSRLPPSSSSAPP